jgi:hypothetical protein
MKHSVLLFVQVMTLCTLASSRAWTATGKEGPLAKVHHDLVVVSDEYVAYLAQGGSAAFTPSNPLLRVHEGRVGIDAVASDDVHTLQADLEAIGMQGAVAFGRIVSGQLPLTAIKALVTLASLQFAQPAYATTQMGPPSPGAPHAPTLGLPHQTGGDPRASD